MDDRKDDGDGIFSDDEFDCLLGTISLPGLPSPQNSFEAQNNKRRRTHDPHQAPDVLDDPNLATAYEPIQFGDFSKYFNNKRQKLKLQESALRNSIPSDQTRTPIFQGLVIHVNGYTNPPLSEIRSLIILHGGTYMAYLDHKSRLTHLIASSLTPRKREEFRAYKVVKPEWILKSIAAGRLLNWTDFRLLNAPSEATIAKGEVTGGLAVTQRDLLSLTKAPHPAHSIPSTRDTPYQSPLSSHRSSLTSSPATATQTDSFTPSGSRSAPSTRLSQKAADELLTSSSEIAKALSNPSSHLDDSSSKYPRDENRSPKKPPNESATPSESHSLEANPEVSNLPAISCTDPNFIQQYFQQSRLHHLSTWKAELLQKVSILSEDKKPSMKSVVPERKLRGDASDKRIIMHVDFDCFFIAAGLIRRPELIGKPLAVCHAKTRGIADQHASTSEIASCSYEARAFGVRNGQTLGKAKELCPEIQTIPYEFALYEDLSIKFYNVLLRYADQLQAVSVDECLVDVGSRFIDQPGYQGYDSIESSALMLAEEIRAVVRKETQCDVSIGISYNVLLAKLATKRAKPNGSFFLTTDRVHSVIKGLSIDDLPGFGWAQKNELEIKLQINKVEDLESISLSRLIEVLGPSRGKLLHQYAQGIDDRSLKSSNHERKSVSAVVNYGIRFKPSDQGGNEDAKNFTCQLGLEVSRRLNELGVSGRQLTLKIMRRALHAPIETQKYMGHGICDELSKTTKLPGPVDRSVNDGVIIGHEAWKLLNSMSIPPEDLRGIGIQINRLEKLGGPAHHLDKPRVQSTLTFQTTKPIELLTRRQGTRSETKAVDSHLKLPAVIHQGLRPIASTPKRLLQTVDLPTSSPLAVPPFSQIDLEVVEALPMPLKSRVLETISSTRQSTSTNEPVKNTVPSRMADLVTPARNPNPVKEYPHQPELPSASQVDWKMLAELPSSVRKPIEAAYARQRRLRRILPPPTPPNFNRNHKIDRRKRTTKLDTSKVKDRFAGLWITVHDQRVNRKKGGVGHRVAPIGPSQKLINKKTFKLITRTQPKKSPDEPQEKSEDESELLPTPNRISDEQLEALEIDVRFFRELKGSSTRGFQLDLIWNQFQLHSERFKEITRKTDRWKRWRKNFDRPSKILQIDLPDRPCLASKREPRSEKGLNKLEDVLDLIEEWVLSCSSNDHSDPCDDDQLLGMEIDERDISIIENFLIDTINPPAPAPAPGLVPPSDYRHPGRNFGQDFEKVFKILEWWEDLIESSFGSSGVCSRRDDDHYPYDHHRELKKVEDPRWIVWQKILDRIKSNVNSIALRDFGAPIYV